MGIHELRLKSLQYLGTKEKLRSKLATMDANKVNFTIGGPKA